MKFEVFQKLFKNHEVITLTEIRLYDPNFHLRQLRFWQDQGKIRQLSRGYYQLANEEMIDQGMWLIANTIYQPSYISLELALSYYGLIPESVYSVTSVSTKKTQILNTPVAKMVYQHIKPNLYFGYRLLSWKQRNILIAEPEKSVLDYMYLHPELKDKGAMEEMRFNREKMKKLMTGMKFRDYLRRFDNQRLNERIKLI